LFFLIFEANAQNWLKFYATNQYHYGAFALETNDRGYLIGAKRDNDFPYSIIYKTDVNGNILWQKTIGNGNANIEDCCKTLDGGFAIIGGIYDKDKSSFFLLKLNSCGEVDWYKKYNWHYPCQVFNILQMKDEGYIIDLSYNIIPSYTKGAVIKLDKKGNSIWENFNLNIPISMLITEDNNIIISANQFYSHQPNGSWSENILTLLDSNGKRIWENIQSDNYNYHSGIKTILTSKNNYYTLKMEDSLPFNILKLLKYDRTGALTQTMTIEDTTVFNFPKDMIPMNDSTFIILTMEDSGKYSGTLRLLKINALGQIINKTTLFQKYALLPSKISATHDGKYLIIGYLQPNPIPPFVGVFIAKVNSDIDQDSFYTKKLRYDSLCTNTIPDSGNISISNAEVINLDTIGIKFTDFKLFPNPAQDFFEISASGLSAEPFYLMVYDVLGRQVSDYQYMPDINGNLSQKINLNNVASGCYLVSLRQGSNYFVKKLIVE